MELDQAQPYHPGKSPKTRLSAKNERQALPLKQSRLSSGTGNIKGGIEAIVFVGQSNGGSEDFSAPFSTWCRGGR